jgi:hypothetical protein
MADFEIEQEDRLRLVEEISVLMKKHHPLIPKIAWAFLWLSDLDNLRQLTADLSNRQNDPEKARKIEHALTMNVLQESVVKPCK